MIILALALALSPQQEATCQQTGSTTRCTTTADSGAALRDNLVRAPADAASAALSGEDAARNRRAAAYAQVGKLIADGRCDDATRLAAFYGQRDIIRDTAKACVK